jgi:hypothetical protein
MVMELEKKKNVRILTKNIQKSLFHLIETVEILPDFVFQVKLVVVAIIGFLIEIIFFSKYY